MAKATPANVELLKTKIVENKLVIGLELVLKQLKLGSQLIGVYLASNCPEKTKQEINYYANLAKVPVFELAVNNEELSIFCKKNYFISVLGIHK